MADPGVLMLRRLVPVILALALVAAACGPDAPPPDNRALGVAQAAEYGWIYGEWECLDHLWTAESGWDHTKSNYAGSGAFGIPQALPGHKMASHGADWQTNPATQIAWGLDYIAGRYGSPCGAWAAFRSKGWY